MTRKFISTILIASTLIVLLGLITYFLTSYSYLKLVSLINYYDKDLVVELNGQKHVLKPFDTQLLKIKDLRNLNVTATIDGQSVYNKSISLSYENQVLGLYFSDVQHCYYQTNLSRELSTLTFNTISTPNDFLLQDANMDSTTYFIPGSAKSDIDLNKTLIGYLPLPCFEITNAESILANNQLFWNYNSQLQREYYFSNVDKINTSTNIDQLVEIKGVGDDKLNFLFINGTILFRQQEEEYFIVD